MDGPFRNMVWALLLTMAVVAVIGVAFFGVGADRDRQTPQTSQLDVAESAARAQEAAGFPVAAPELGAQWRARQARFTDGDSPRWQVRYTSPSGKLVSLDQGPRLDPALISATMPGATAAAETAIEGARCQQLSGAGQSAGETGWACAGKGYGMVVHGAASAAEVEQAAKAALASVG